LLLEALYGDDTVTTDDSATKTDVAEEQRRDAGRLEQAQPEVEDEIFRETMRSLIAERWQVVLETIPAALEGMDIEGVHDVRVASRRLRAAMDVAAPAFPGKWYKPLQRTAKEITGALGEVRDRDVLLEALRADRSAAPLAEHPGIDRLIFRAECERVAARVEMERYLRQLLDGPLRSELARRFGFTQAPANGPELLEERAS
jgi:CHAD domain-containing protein